MSDFIFGPNGIMQQPTAPADGIGLFKPPADDDIHRMNIPSRESLPTKYSPLGNFMTVVPLPTPTKAGELHLPDRYQSPMTEGHVVEKGPRVSDQINVGDCVMWDPSAQWRMNVDGVSFVLVSEPNIIMRIPREKLEMDLELWRKQDKAEAKAE